jgi:hypothetical protein
MRFFLKESHYRDILQSIGVLLQWAGPFVSTLQTEFLQGRAEYYSSNSSEISEILEFCRFSARATT